MQLGPLNTLCESLADHFRQHGLNAHTTIINSSRPAMRATANPHLDALTTRGSIPAVRFQCILMIAAPECLFSSRNHVYK